MKEIMKRLIVLILAAVFLTGFTGKTVDVSAKAKPSRPSVTLLRSGSGTEITVTIGKTPGAEGYRIYLKESGAAKYKRVKTLKKSGVEVRTYRIKKLDPDRVYQIKVRAYGSDGGKKVWSKYSEVRTARAEISKGVIITFGSYEQDADFENGPEPLEWIVLSRDGDRLFLVSAYALEAGVIDEDEGDVRFDGYWKNSEMRSYLNNSFISKAFTEEEAAAIAYTELEDAGTADRVFLLSLDEVKNAELGFERTEDRRCAPTSYAVYWEDEETECEGVWIWNDPEFGPVYRTNDHHISCFWWLRTPCTDKTGTPNGSFYMVRDSGKFTEVRCWGEDVYTGRADYDEEFYIEDSGFGIRPAMVITVAEASKKLIGLTDRTMK